MRTPKTKLPQIPISTRRTTGGFSSKTALIFMFLIVIACLIFLYTNHIADLESSHHHYTTSPMDGIDTASVMVSPTIGGISTRLNVLEDPYIPPVKIDGYLMDSRSSDIRGIPPLVAPIQTTPNLTKPIMVSPNLVAPINIAQNILYSSQNRASIVPPSSALLPVNMETRGIQNTYNQIGILTKWSGETTKRPLFSRNRNGLETPEMESEPESRLILPLFGRRHLIGRDKWQYYAISNTGNLNTKLPIRSNGRSCTSEYGCDPLSSGDVVYVEGYNHAFKATIYENTMFSYLPVL